MIFLRSLLFNISFFAWSLLSAIIFAPLFIFSSELAQKAGRPWALGSLYLAKLWCGIDYEIRGAEHMIHGPVIYASKHQSAWDTLIFLVLFNAPAYVLKRELLSIPFWGWYLWRMKMIAIDRSAGASSIKHMLRQSKNAVAKNRPIVIFPEGTRTKPGAEPHYHPGVVALYSQMELPVIPIALNSGVYWGKNAFIKRPGRIIMEFLPAIPPGMDKKLFNASLQQKIENASAQLLREAKTTIH
jgi:1-acyl-sn-glycerol-3-phosphate acyltransferase